jgi:hypothetical protein
MDTYRFPSITKRDKACPRNGLVPRILKGLSQERACPKNFEGPVPKAGLSQAF